MQYDLRRTPPWRWALKNNDAYPGESAEELFLKVQFSSSQAEAITNLAYTECLFCGDVFMPDPDDGRPRRVLRGYPRAVYPVLTNQQGAVAFCCSEQCRGRCVRLRKKIENPNSEFWRARARVARAKIRSAIRSQLQPARGG